MGKPAVYDPTQITLQVTNHTNFLALPLIPIPGLGFSRNVFFEGRPAVPAGSRFIVHDIPTDPISAANPARRPHNDVVFDGCPNVFVNGKPMGRIGDKITSPATMVPPFEPAGFLRCGAVTVNCSDLPGLPIFTP